MQQIKLSIKSFDFFSIKNAIKNLHFFFKLSTLTFMEQQLFLLNGVPLEDGEKLSKKKILSLPTNVKKFTLIKSPHIDKKSREQFKLRRYKTLLFLNIKNVKNLSFFIYMIKNTEFPGVEIQINIKDTTYFLPSSMRTSLLH